MDPRIAKIGADICTLKDEDTAVISIVVLRAIAWLKARGFVLEAALPIGCELAEWLEPHIATNNGLLVGLAAYPGIRRGAEVIVADDYARMDAWAEGAAAQGAALLGINVAITRAEMRAAAELDAVRHVH